MVDPRMKAYVTINKSIREHSIVLVLGSGYPDFIRPNWSEILNPTAQPDGRLSLSEARNISDWVRNADDQMSVIFESIARLPIRTIISFNFGSRLYGILRSRDPGWIFASDSVNNYNRDRKTIIPFGGSIESIDSRSLDFLKPHDYVQIPRKQEVLWEQACQIAARGVFLVLGCDPGDCALPRLLHAMNTRTNLGWIVSEKASEEQAITWNAVGIEVLDENPCELLRSLESTLKSRSSVAGAITQPAGREKVRNPYRGLDSFDKKEAALFFGRERDTQHLVTIASAQRFSILAGVSGSGKTSLLQAGLLARHDLKSRYPGVYIRCGDNPISALIESCVNEWQLRREEYGDNLADVKKLFQYMYDLYDEEPLIIFDQAEELFVQVGESIRQQIYKLILDCITSAPIIARIVFSLRADYLPRLLEATKLAPTILRNTYFLNELDHEGAVSAIIEPARACGIEFSADLAERIVTELSQNGIVSPPQIQIVCCRLYESKDDRGIRDHIYEKLGRASNILANYLNQQIDSVSNDTDEARQILKAMVTSRGTKDVLRPPEIAERSGLSVDQTQNWLNVLKDTARLVRTVEIDKEKRYELSHEYLTDEIWRWMGNDDIQRRQAEEILSREMKSWKIYPVIRLGMDLIEAVSLAEDAIAWKPETLTLYLLSRVRYGLECKISILEDEASNSAIREKIFQTTCSTIAQDDQDQKRDAAELLGILGASMIRRAICKYNFDPVMMATLVELLGGLEDVESVNVITHILQSAKESNLRKAAIGALGEVGDRKSVEALRNIARNANSLDERTLAVGALGRSASDEALDEIVRALESGSEPLIDAVKTSLLHAKKPHMIITLLLSNDVALENKIVVLEGVVEIIYKLINSLLMIMSDFPEDVFKPVVELVSPRLYGEHIDSLKYLRNSEKSHVQDWAKTQIAILREEEEETQEAVKQVRSIFGRKFSLEKFTSIVEDEDVDKIFEAQRLLRKYIRSNSVNFSHLDDLLMRNNPVVQAAILQCFDESQSCLPILRKNIVRLLNGEEVTLLYYAILAVMHLERDAIWSEAVRQISRYSSDTRKPMWYVGNVGMTLKDAVHYVLDEIKPMSSIWRKDFQTTFDR